MRLILRYLIHQPAHVGTLDTNALDRLGLAVRAGQVDLRLPRSGDGYVGGFVIEGVDHEPEVVSTVDSANPVSSYMRLLKTWLLRQP